MPTVMLCTVGRGSKIEMPSKFISKWLDIITLTPNIEESYYMTFHSINTDNAIIRIHINNILLLLLLYVFDNIAEDILGRGKSKIHKSLIFFEIMSPILSL